MRDMDFDRREYMSMEPGATMKITSLVSLPVGASVVAVRNGEGFSSGTEAAVLGVEGGKVSFVTNRRKKYTLHPAKFVTVFERRLGPVVPSAIYPGCCIKAVVSGDGYSKGDVLTLTETSGRIYGFKTLAGGKGSVKADDIGLCFRYV